MIGFRLAIRGWLAAGTMLVAGVAFGDQFPTSIQGQESSVSLGNYNAVEPKTFEELPAEIRSKVNAYLIDRLGKDYLARLQFVGGQVVDFEELYRINPGAKQYKWKVFAYRLGIESPCRKRGLHPT